MKSVKRTDETVASFLLQHLADVAHATDGELVVVELVARRGSRVHDIIALLLLVLALGFSRSALGSRVVLRRRKKRKGYMEKVQSVRAEFTLNIHESGTSKLLTGEPKLCPTS